MRGRFAGRTPDGKEWALVFSRREMVRSAFAPFFECAPLICKPRATGRFGLAHRLRNQLHPALPSGQLDSENEDVNMRLWILPIAALVGFVVGCNKSPEGG